MVLNGMGIQKAVYIPHGTEFEVIGVQDLLVFKTERIGYEEK